MNVIRGMNGELNAMRNAKCERKGNGLRFGKKVESEMSSSFFMEFLLSVFSVPTLEPLLDCHGLSG